MADFRRWFTVLAVLALTAGLASAQVGTAGTTVAGSLACTANGAAIPQLRVEGFTELVGDVLINCTGGPGTNQYAPGSLIPTTNITVIMTGNATNAITSRLMGSQSNGAGVVSEVTLLIDEPGSGLATPATGNFGPKAPQTLCGTAAGCAAYVGVDSSLAVEVACANNSSTLTSACSANAQNMYQGYVGASGANTVEFFGVPVLPPVTSGVNRVFRITNIRYPVTQMGTNSQVTAQVSTSPSQILPLGGNNGSSFPVGVVAPPLTAKVAYVSAANPLPQCVSQNQTQVATLSYTEGFATAFKTRVVPLGNTTYTAEGNNALQQNIPGGLYAGFAANSESGFIVPGDTNSTFTAGLADFGTRLKAVFTNIPQGVTLYVSTTNINGSAPSNPGGNTLNSSWAVLVATGTGEATADPGTGFAPVSTAANFALAPNSSGVATAVWEVVNSQPSTTETLQFGVYVSYKATASGGTYPSPAGTGGYGLPQPTTYNGAPVTYVSMSYAPESSQSAFGGTAGPVASTSTPIPRFVISNVYSGPWANINLCQTTLLYPFVTANPNGPLGQGFDTGIAVANTSSDPFGTAGVIGNTTTAPHQTGSCTLYPYGVTMTATGGSTAGPTTPLPGCDGNVVSPSEGTNCFGIVPTGQVKSILVSQIWPGFQGYVIAVCNFYYAHGYAAVTDLGIRNFFTDYLALEMIPNSSLQSGVNRGTGVEQFIH